MVLIARSDFENARNPVVLGLLSGELLAIFATHPLLSLDGRLVCDVDKALTEVLLSVD